MDQHIPHLPQGLSRKEIDNPQVLAAIARVPRRCFVPTYLNEQADDDRALPIGEGQTISQPFIVGLMSQLCELREGDKVLEIGTGSGYQAAVLAELGAEVYSLEILPSHFERARRILNELGYSRVHTFLRDGWNGLEQYAPYDVILFTAACPQVPHHLFAQLGPGGRMILPLADDDGDEQLVVYRKTADGLVQEKMARVRFVPLTGEGQAALSFSNVKRQRQPSSD